jgi:hypothetical protein
MGTKLLKNSVLLIVSFFIFSGCEDLSTTGRIREKYKYPKELWGEWIRMDTGDTWYFASNYTKNNYYGSDKVTFYRESPNVIKVTDNNKVFYLYASRIPNGTFTGTVVNG